MTEYKRLAQVQTKHKLGTEKEKWAQIINPKKWFVINTCWEREIIFSNVLSLDISNTVMDPMPGIICSTQNRLYFCLFTYFLCMCFPKIWNWLLILCIFRSIFYKYCCCFQLSCMIFQQFSYWMSLLCKVQ